MSDETVMQRVDRNLADTGLHAVTPGSVERLVAEVERLRADALESIAREGVLRAYVERFEHERNEAWGRMDGLERERDEARDDRDEAQADLCYAQHQIRGLKGEVQRAAATMRAEVERLRAEVERLRAASDRASRAEAEVERLRLAVVIKDDRVSALRAERDALREAAQWILHTITGVSRDGGPVTDDECLASYDALRAAIEGEGASDGIHRGRVPGSPSRLRRWCGRVFRRDAGA